MLSRGEQVRPGKIDVFVAVSRDGARTFGSPVQVNATAGEARLGGEMPPRIVLRSRGSGDPEMVVLWTARGESTAIRTARSIDGGKTFLQPRRYRLPVHPAIAGGRR